MASKRDIGSLPAVAPLAGRRLTNPGVSLLAAAVAGLAAAVAFARFQRPIPERRVPATVPAADRDLACHHPPAAFVPNLGQWPHPARYVASIGGGTVFVEDSGFLLAWCEHRGGAQSRGAAVRMRFARGAAAELQPERRLAGRHNYLCGDDPARWRDVPLHGAVRYRRPVPGVDVLCYAKDGHLEYDLELAPGADLTAVEFAVEGAGPLTIDEDGALVMATAAGLLRQPPPVTYELAADGSRRPVAASYELRGADRFGFAAPRWSGQMPLVIDPGVLWSTFAGGSDTDGASDIAVDASGIVTITGNTFSPGYPTTTGAWDPTHGGSSDAYVSRFDPALPAAQQLLYSTFVGGTGDDLGLQLAVDAAGIVTVMGYTDSPDFPTTANAWNPVFNGGYDVVLVQLDPSLPAAQQIRYATFLGGTGFEWPQDMAVDTAGVVTITGATGSGNYPTTPGAWNRMINGRDDVFVSQLDPSQPAAQQLVYSTFVGTTDWDMATGVAADGGLVTIVGYTSSPAWPTTAGAWSTAPAGGGEVFVTRLRPSLPAAQQVVYSTFVGGTGDDGSAAVAVDAGGLVTLTGATGSTDYPTTPNAYDATANGGLDAFLTRFDPTLSTVLYSTFLGGGGEDAIGPFHADVAGVITAVGRTQSNDFPTTPGAFDTTHNGGDDVCVVRLDPARPPAQQLVYSTFLGATNAEYPAALSVDAAGIATLAGATQSGSYPTTAGAWDTAHNGRWDCFVTRLDLLPRGVTAYGASTAGCAGLMRAGVVAWPQVGNTAFAITCTPSNAVGLLAVGAAPTATPSLLAGAAVWLDLQSPVTTVLIGSTGFGSSVVPVPIPARPALAGLHAFAQHFWLDTCAPGGVSASNALAIVVQP